MSAYPQPRRDLRQSATPPHVKHSRFQKRIAALLALALLGLGATGNAYASEAAILNSLRALSGSVAGSDTDNVYVADDSTDALSNETHSSPDNSTAGSTEPADEVAPASPIVVWEQAFGAPTSLADVQVQFEVAAAQILAAASAGESAEPADAGAAVAADGASEDGVLVDVVNPAAPALPGNYYLLRATLTNPEAAEPTVVEALTSAQAFQVGPDGMLGFDLFQQLIPAPEMPLDIAGEQEAEEGEDHPFYSMTFDRLEILDVTPSVHAGFASDSIEAGDTATLSLVIVNTAELPAIAGPIDEATGAATPGIQLAVNLPDGLVVADDIPDTCSTGMVIAEPGDTTISVAANLGQGQADCPLAVSVVAIQEGDYVIAPENFDILQGAYAPTTTSGLQVTLKPEQQDEEQQKEELDTEQPVSEAGEDEPTNDKNDVLSTPDLDSDLDSDGGAECPDDDELYETDCLPALEDCADDNEQLVAGECAPAPSVAIEGDPVVGEVLTAAVENVGDEYELNVSPMSVVIPTVTTPQPPADAITCTLANPAVENQLRSCITNNTKVNIVVSGNVNLFQQVNSPIVIDSGKQVWITSQGASAQSLVYQGSKLGFQVNGAGSQLVLQNITLNGNGGSTNNSMISVSGGTLYVGAGATIQGSTLTLLSGNGTAINASNGAGIYVNNANIYGLRAATGNGGAIWADAGTVLSVANSSISDSTAYTGSGGGIYLNSSASNPSTLNILGNYGDYSNSMQSNWAGANGGSIYAGPAANVVIDSAIINNSVAGVNSSTAAGTGSGHGGAIYLAPGTNASNLTNLTVQNGAQIDSNFAGYIYIGGTNPTTTATTNTAGNGGGIYGDNYTNITIDNSQVSNNSALWNGGGIATGTNSTVNVQNGAQILANSAAGATGSTNVGGGGLFVDASSQLNVNSGANIENNLAYTYGGGIYAGTGAIVNVDGTNGGATIQNNSAGTVNMGSGGGIYLVGGTVNAIPMLTLLNAKVIGNKAGYQADGITPTNCINCNGGGIYTGQFGVINIQGTSQVSGNTVTTGAGGIYLGNTGQLTLDAGTAVSNNTASAGSGGGILLAAHYATVINNGGAIDGNTAGINGGGIGVNSTLLNGIQITSTGGSISNNTATGAGSTANQSGWGGGIFVDGNNPIAQLSVTNTTISNNKAGSATDTTQTRHGGGISVGGGVAPVTITTSHIDYNTTYGNLPTGAPGGNSLGGGVYMFKGQLTVSGGTFTGNVAAYHGGGIYMENGDTNAHTKVDIKDGAVFSNNWAGYDPDHNGITFNPGNYRGYGGAIYSYGNTDVTVSGDSKITGNWAYGAAGGISFGNHSTLNISGSGTEVSNNFAGGGAGGILTGQSSQLVIDGASVSNNRSGSDGGGIYLNNTPTEDLAAGLRATLTLQNGARVIGNRAGYDINNTALNSTSRGGGIQAFVNGTINITSGSQVSNNWATQDGGGIGTSSGVIVNITGDTTLVGSNQAARNGGGLWLGFYQSGASIYDSLASANVTDATIADNTAVAGDGGGIYAASTYTSVAVSGAAKVQNNQALAGNGGGIWVRYASPTDNELAGLTVADTASFSGNLAQQAYPIRNPLDNTRYTSNITTSAATWSVGAAAGNTPAPMAQGYNNYDITYAYTPPSCPPGFKADDFSGPDHNIPPSTSTQSSWLVGSESVLATALADTSAPNILITLCSDVTLTTAKTGGASRAVTITSDGLNPNDTGGLGRWSIIRSNGSNGLNTLTGATSLLNVPATPASLTLTNVIIDGNSVSGVTQAAITVGTTGTPGTLTLGSGSVVQYNINSSTGSTSSTTPMGGGVSAKAGATVNINGGIIQNNSGALGGGIAIAGSSSLPATLNLTSGLITHNNATTYGGGIWSYSSNATLNITGGSIISNTAPTGDGGGIYIRSSSSTTPSSLNISGDLQSDPATWPLISQNTAGAPGDTVARNGGGIYIGTYVGTSAAPVTISNATISGNTNNGGGTAAGNGYGGGIYLGTTGTVNITNTHITGNTANYGGGVGIYTSGSTVNFTGSVVDGNTVASGGGGIGVYGSASNSSLTLDNTSVSGNSTGQTTTNGSGGGIWVNASNTTLNILNNSRINNNTAYLNGGGIYTAANTTATASITIDSSDISGNSQTYVSDTNGGGGLYLLATTSPINITNSTITNNTVAGLGGGGLFFTNAPQVNITASTFTGNTATKSSSSGGAIYSNRNATGGTAPGTTLQTITITDSTIGTQLNPNSAGANGGGIAYRANSALVLTGSTKVEWNTASAGGGIYNTETATLDVQANTSISHNQAIAGSSTLATAGSGGGMLLNSTAATNITGATIQANSATQNGGGIWTNTATQNAPINLVITDTLIKDNTAATKGGGIFTGSYNNLTLQGTTLVTGNQAPDAGGIHLTQNVTVKQIGASVNGNFATNGNGGGYYLAQGTGSSFSLSGGATLNGNIASVSGGGMWLVNTPGNTEPAVRNTISLVDTMVDGNRAGYLTDGTTPSSPTYPDGTQTSPDGGGISAGNYVTTILQGNTVVSNNKAQRMGGGISTEDHAVYQLSGPAQIVDNEAVTGDGGGVVTWAYANVTLAGGQILRNKAAGAGGGISINAISSLAMSQGAKVNGNTAGGNGGGIELRGDTTGFTMTDSFVQDNVAGTTPTQPGDTNNGGGIYVGSNGTSAVTTSPTFILDNAQITGNTIGYTADRLAQTSTSRGGGLYSAAQANYIFRNNTLISNNWASSGGGGVYLTAGSITTAPATVSLESGTKVTQNLAGSSNGGGMAIMLPSASQVSLSGSSVQVAANGAGGNGGGIYTAPMTGSTTAGTGASLTISDSSISNNEAGQVDGVYSEGGGIYAIAANTVMLSNAEISGNRAGYRLGNAVAGNLGKGGGISIGKYQLNPTVTAVSLQGSTDIHDNIASSDGGGIYLAAGAGTLQVSDASVFEDNTAVGDGGAIWVRYNSPTPSDNDLSALSVGANVVFSGNTAAGVVPDRNRLDDGVYASNIAGTSWSYAANAPTIPPASASGQGYPNPFTGQLLQGYNNFDIHYAYTPECPAGLVLSADDDVNGVANYLIGSDEWLGLAFSDSHATINATLCTSFTISSTKTVVAGKTINLTSDMHGPSVDAGRWTVTRGPGMTGLDVSMLRVAPGGTLNATNVIIDGGWNHDTNSGVQAQSAAVAVGNFTTEPVQAGVIPRATFGVGATIQNNNSVYTSDRRMSDGGGIHGHGGAVITLNSGAIVQGNIAKNGGGIGVTALTTMADGNTLPATLYVNGTAQVINNTARAYGGGVYGFGGSVITNGGLFDGNTAATGGGLDLSDAFGNSDWTGLVDADWRYPITINNSQITNNRATGGYAGGIEVYSNSATVTISNTEVSDNSASTHTGGIRLSGYNSVYSNIDYAGKFLPAVELNNVTVTGNNASSYAGGLSTGNAVSDVTINDSTFTGNQAGLTYAGAIRYSGNAAAPSSILTIRNSTIGTVANPNVATTDGGGIWANNGATIALYGTTSVDGNTAGNNGGGIFADSGVTVIMGSAVISVSNNKASANGGGIYANGGGLANGATSTLNLLGGSISGNEVTANSSAAANGGGIFIGSDADLTLGGPVVQQNSTINAGSGEANGGGVYLDTGATAFIYGTCLIDTNTAGTAGGGIYVTGNSTVGIASCTISGNTAGGTHGGGVYLGAGSGLNVTYTAFTGNTAEQNGGGIYAASGYTPIAITGASSFTNNYAGIEGDGGAIWVPYFSPHNNELAYLEVDADVEFSGNWARESYDTFNPLDGLDQAVYTANIHATVWSNDLHGTPLPMGYNNYDIHYLTDPTCPPGLYVDMIDPNSDYNTYLANLDNGTLYLPTDPSFGSDADTGVYLVGSQLWLERALDDFKVTDARPERRIYLCADVTVDQTHAVPDDTVVLLTSDEDPLAPWSLIRDVTLDGATPLLTVPSAVSSGVLTGLNLPAGTPNLTATRVIIDGNYIKNVTAAAVDVLPGGALLIGDQATVQNNYNTAQGGFGGGIHGGAGSVITVSGAGATVTGNKAHAGTDNEGDQGGSGGGIAVDAEATLTISNGALVSNNGASENGGGVYAAAGTNLLVADASVLGNFAGQVRDGDGGGIYLAGGGSPASALTLNGAYIQDNGAGYQSYTDPHDGTESGGNLTSDGGGVWVGQGVAVTVGAGAINGGTLVSYNEAVHHGGGIFADVGSSITMSNSNVTDNLAGQYTNGSGGGIYLAGGTGTNAQATLSLADSYVTDNDAGYLANGTPTEFLSSDGGGIWAGDYSTVNVGSGTQVLRNMARHDGGGIRTGKPSAVNVAADATVNSNTAGRQGGGIYTAGGSSVVKIDGGTVSGNLAGQLDDNGHGGGISMAAGTDGQHLAKVWLLNGAQVTENRAGYPAGDAATVSPTGFSASGGGIATSNYATVIVDGGTLGSSVERNMASRNGGGITAGLIADAANNNTVTVSAFSTVDDNSAGMSGGGIWIGRTSALTVDDSSVSYNLAGLVDANYGNGGGIASPGGADSASGTTVTLHNAMLQSNAAGYRNDGGVLTSTSVANANGGAIYLGGVFNGNIDNNTGSIVDTGSIIANNQAKQNGGGVYLGASSVISIDNSEISGNTAGISGGGIYLVDSTSTDVWQNAGQINQTNNAAVIWNTAVTGNGGGIYAGAYNQVSLTGGSYLNDDDVYVDYGAGVIAGNTAGKNGGGISIGTGGFLQTYANLSNNTAGNDGGAIWADTGANVRPNKGEFYQNHAGRNGGAIFYGSGAFDTDGYALNPMVSSQVVFNGNSADNHGGAVYLAPGYAAFQLLPAHGTAFINNAADADGDGIGDGGAIWVRYESPEDNELGPLDNGLAGLVFISGGDYTFSGNTAATVSPWRNPLDDAVYNNKVLDDDSNVLSWSSADGGLLDAAVAGETEFSGPLLQGYNNYDIAYHFTPELSLEVAKQARTVHPGSALSPGYNTETDDNYIYYPIISAARGSAYVADVVDWLITVTNTGTVPLVGVELQDRVYGETYPDALRDLDPNDSFASERVYPKYDLTCWVDSTDGTAGNAIQDAGEASFNLSDPTAELSYGMTVACTGSDTVTTDHAQAGYITNTLSATASWDTGIPASSGPTRAITTPAITVPSNTDVAAVPVAETQQCEGAGYLDTDLSNPSLSVYRVGSQDWLGYALADDKSAPPLDNVEIILCQNVTLDATQSLRADTTVVITSDDNNPDIDDNNPSGGAPWSLIRGDSLTSSLLYVPSGSSLSGTRVIFDGNSVADVISALLSTAGGSITLGSETIVRNNLHVGSGDGGGIAGLDNSHITLENGAIVINNTTGGNGGGIYAGADSVVVVDNATVENNWAGQGSGVSGIGGGIYLLTGSVTLTDATITRNLVGLWRLTDDSVESTGAYRGDGGGFGAGGDGITVTLNGKTQITDNQAHDNSAGIGLGSGSTLNINQGALIANNSAGAVGGGIGAASSNDVTITGATIQDNLAGQDTHESNWSGGGGGIYLTSGGNLVLTDTLVTGNKAGYFANGTPTGNTNGDGGGIYAGNYVGVTIQGTTQVVDNMAIRDGGGMYLGQGPVYISGSAQFSSNSAAGDGGGLYLAPGYWTAQLTGTVTFQGNIAGGDGGGIWERYATPADNELQGLHVGAAVTFSGNEAASVSPVRNPGDNEVYVGNIATTAWSLDDNGKPLSQGYNNYDIAYRAAPITVVKVDGLTTADLAGADFELYSDPALTPESMLPFFATHSGNASIADGSTDSASSTGDGATWTAGLTYGQNYYLVEAKAPAGYRLLAEPVVISVSDAGKVTTNQELTAYTCAVTLDSEGEPVALALDDSACDYAGDVSQLPVGTTVFVRNYTMDIALPRAGGSGTPLWVWLVPITLTALTVLAVKRNRPAPRRRQTATVSA